MRDCGGKTSAARCWNVPETCLGPYSTLKNQIAMLTGLVQQPVGGQPGSGEAGGWGMLALLAGGPWDLCSAALRGWLCPGDMERKALGLPTGLVGMD